METRQLRADDHQRTILAWKYVLALEFDDLASTSLAYVSFANVS